MIRLSTILTIAILANSVTSTVLFSQQIQSKHLIKPIDSIKGLPSRIAFGSCGKQTKPQPILHQIVATQPDLFIYLGDNIYGDTKDMQVLADKYTLLGNKPEFQNLAGRIPLLAVWDDHDFGWNDAGKEYPFKEQSKALFMDFWQVPKDSDRRQHKGIYGAHQFTANGKTLQVILLDTRTFRDPLMKNQKKDKRFKNDYQPDDNASKTLLGKTQWQWLRSEFKKPADLRIVCSSIQFGHSYNGWESWTNLPAEQQKMVSLIQETKANGVVFVSGDVHWGELNRRDFDGVYPIYDTTASGLTETWYNVEPSKFRIGQAVRENHFGTILIDWEAKDPQVVFQIIDLKGTVRLANSVKLSKLKFAE